MTTQTKFKQTEIGMIPEDWDVKMIGDFLDIRHGFAFKGEFFSDAETDNILLTPGNFNIGGGFKSDKLKFTTEEPPKDYVLKEGDIIVTMTDLSKKGDTLGYSAKIPPTKNKKYLHNQRVGLVNFKSDKVNSNFIYWVLRTKRYNIFVVGSATGSTVKHTSPNRIKLFEFGVPTITEQTHIAKILSSLDSKIELNQQMNKTLEAIGQAIFKRWFVDFEFPNEKGKPYKSSGGEMVDSEIGKIPEGWGVKELPEIALVIDCLHTKKPDQTTEGKILLQFYNLNKTHNIDISNPYYVNDKDYENWAKNIEVSNGDILFTNAARQAIAKVPYWFKGGIGRNITAIRSRIDPAYLLEYFLSKCGREQISKNTDQGTIFSSLNVKGIRKLKILTPPNEITKLYSNIAGKLRLKIEINEAESTNLSQIRDSLLPKLMSGKIRVPVEVRA